MPQAQYSWECTSCGRRVPTSVDTCRCGQDRLENAQHLVVPPDSQLSSSSGAGSLLLGFSQLAFGYRQGLAWPGRHAWMFGVGFALALVAVFAAALAQSNHELAPTAGNIRLTARLDEFTRAQDPQTANSIPAFLMLPGLLGILPAPPGPGTSPMAPATERGSDESAPGRPRDEASAWPVNSTVDSEPARDHPDRPSDEPAESGSESPSEVGFAPPVASSLPSDVVRPVEATELAKGFCTPSSSLRIRQRFPGVYDAMSDKELEERVLAKYPDYQDELCVLPAWVGADPHQIVKYDIQPIAAVASWAGATLRALLWTTLFALAVVNLFYRLIVPLASTS